MNPIHDMGGEYLDVCSACGTRIELVQEGTFGNPQPDITMCACAVIEHENSVTIMGQTLRYGHNRIVAAAKTNN